jgi:hypothetical protein
MSLLRTRSVGAAEPGTSAERPEERSPDGWRRRAPRMSPECHSAAFVRSSLTVVRFIFSVTPPAARSIRFALGFSRRLGA